MSTLQHVHRDTSSKAWLAGPLIGVAGVAIRPFVSSFLDTEEIAHLVGESPTRWVAGTALIAAGYSLSTLGFHRTLASAHPLGSRSRGRWVTTALVLGSAALAYQFGGSGIGLYGTVKSSGDVLAYLEQAARWETPALVSAIVLLGIGWWGTARFAVSSGQIEGRTGTLARSAAVLAAAGFLLPSSIGEYLSLAGLAGLAWLVRPKEHASVNGPGS